MDARSVWASSQDMDEAWGRMAATAWSVLILAIVWLAMQALPVSG
jgi:hypothetical protein